MTDVDKEREAIVAWLRKESGELVFKSTKSRSLDAAALYSIQINMVDQMANEIERGLHHIKETT